MATRSTEEKMDDSLPPCRVVAHELKLCIQEPIMGLMAMLFVPIMGLMAMLFVPIMGLMAMLFVTRADRRSGSGLWGIVSG